MTTDYEEAKDLYERLSYIAAYSKHTDMRVLRCPIEAVGGLWDELGQLQLDFMVARGLAPEHTLLDFGCGTLRGGRKFIPYLQAGKYFGLDISVEAIRYAQELVQAEVLTEKNPVLHVDKSLRMDVSLLGVDSFDFVLAQSVFTHLHEQYVEQVIRNIRSVMLPNSRFFFTFLEQPEYDGLSHKDFYHKLQYFERIARLYGFQLKDYTSEYCHPRGHRMVEFTLI